MSRAPDPHSDLLAELNPEQGEAVGWPGGPLLILAGAGSGKTRVLIYRTMWLAQNAGVDPGNVLAVTFTNKAAGEMRHRLGAKIGIEAAKRAWFHTFHGACLRMLRRDIEGRVDGFRSGFGIFDDDDQIKLMKGLMSKAKVSETFNTPRSLLSRIHDAKNKMIGPAEFARTMTGFNDEAAAKVYPLYQAALRENNAVDFDDIILLAVEMLERHPHLLASYQDKFKHILVDEYQDTNKAQYRLVTLLASRDRNLACVGDDDQGIYAWRGADIQNILDFQKDYPDAKVVKLVRNYRSTKNILAGAMAVISKNRGRYGKELWTENPTGEPIRIYEARDERDEGRWICDETTRLAQSPTAGHARKDVAIFYRTNAQSRALEEALRARGLPYRLVGALRFFERAEIKDTLAYLRSAVNPADSMALKRILNVPPRGIGDTTVDRIEAFADAKKIPFPDAVQRIDEITEVKAGTRKKIADFNEIMAAAREDAKTAAPAAFLRRLVDTTGYLEWLGLQGAIADGDDTGARVENVGQLIASATELSIEEPGATAADFLDRVQLVSDVDDLDETADAVTLMTFHAAKGLEFPVVFMTGMEEGIFPHARALDPEAGPKQMEEERRLCYVGMTRARQKLYLTLARDRATWGARRPLGPSRFIEELPKEIVSEVRAPRAAPEGSGPSFRGGFSGGGWAGRRARGEGGGAAGGRGADGFDRGPMDDFDQRPAYDDDGPAPWKPPPPSRGPVSSGAWRTGMRIVHAQFGEGVIRAVENGKIDVAFAQGGMRKLLLKYAGKDIRPAD